MIARQAARALLAALSVLMLTACSVDTSDVTFQKDSVFYGPGSAGAMGVGGLPGVVLPTKCDERHADGAQPEVDNFEDANDVLLPLAGRAGGWYTYNDGVGTQMPPPGPAFPSMPGAGGSKFAMHTGGLGFTKWGAGLGFVPLTRVDARACPYDLSPHHGLRFMAKGHNSSGKLRVQVATALTQPPEAEGVCTPADKCGDHYGFTFMLPAEWAQVQVSWSEMKQTGWGQAVDLDLAHTLNVEFVVPASVGFDYWLDDVSFY